MSDNMTAILILSTINLSLIIYDALLITRLIQARTYKDRKSYMKLAPLLPIRHNTITRQKKMTEKQITLCAIIAIFVITCVVVSSTTYLIKNFLACA